MKMRRAISALLAAFLMFGILPICTLGTSAEGADTVYATTRESLEQGSYAYAYVYLDDLTDLAALTVAVHYDPQAVTVESSYNQVACEMYDSSNTDGCLQFTYLFDGEGENTQTNLFYFYYQINPTAPVGDTYFDIVVSDACDTALNPMEIGGSRTHVSVTERTAAENCDVYASSSIATAVTEEFTVSYRLSTSQIASGAFEISYDRDLFEFVELTKGSFLDGKVTDVNSTLDGTVAVSFVGTAYQSAYELVTVTFRTLENLDTVSEIKLTVKEFYDLDLNPITCMGYTTEVAVAFDESYTVDAPAMKPQAEFDAESGKLTVTVELDAESRLGAGDFTLRFDPELLTYVSAQKGFVPTFFNINEKNVAAGVLKFSIVSLSDITEALRVLTVTFDVSAVCEETITSLTLEGSGLTDAMTQPITLHFEGTDVAVITGHRYDENGTCTGCGESRMVFSGASLTLEDNIAVNYKFDPAQLNGTGYSDPYVVFRFNGEEFTVTKYTKDSRGRYAYTFSDIAPRMMNDEIEATLYATYEGEVVACQTRSYSVKQYCYNMLARCNEGGAYANNTKFKALLVDLLNYGEAAQLYGNYQTDTLVTADLTDTQKAWATATAPTLGSVQSLTYKTIENPSVTWLAGGLLLEDAVTMRFKFSAPTTQDLTVHFCTDQNPTGWVIGADAFVQTNGGYYVYFDGLKARQMRETVYVTVYQGDVAVSNTVSYSIESYAYAKRNDSNTKLVELLTAMMKYGDSAYRYING